VTNVLAYYARELTTAVKSFMVLVPWQSLKLKKWLKVLKIHEVKFDAKQLLKILLKTIFRIAQGPVL
jgi:hypothetical protein